VLRAQTADLHREAERSGVIHDLLTGHAEVGGLVLLLRNLLAVYCALEAGLEVCRDHPVLRDLACRPLYRSAALQSDLHRLGSDPVLLSEGVAYATRVERAAAEHDAAGLLAFVYVRYLGDLSGGQILNRLLGRTLGLAPLAFYSFPEIPDLKAFAVDFRAEIDRAGAKLDDTAPVIAQAMAAFQQDTALSIAVSRYCSEQVLGKKR
jgi:heme oxygenase